MDVPNEKRTRILLQNLALPYREPASAAIALAAKNLKNASLRAEDLTVYRRSVDARKKDEIRFVYSIAAQVPGQPRPEQLRKLDAVVEKTPEPAPSCGAEKMDSPPVVVGFGPCGMFAALALAQAGFRPVVLERGDDVDTRHERVRHFFNTGELDEECNVQFGAGGAGTFSDGKLLSRIGDPLGRRVLETFAAFGAPKSVLTLAKPHVGTDKLLGVVRQAQQEILRLGGTILFRTKMEGLLLSENGNVRALRTSAGEIPCGAVILALGHSARDTYRMLLSSGFTLVGKDFSVGARVEHLQEEIDCALYGSADVSILGHAEYALSYREGQRGVYSFCMCPGGEVVCSSSRAGELVVNGMSNSARSGKNANAAIAVSVLKSDYGATPEGAVAFQEAIEKKAFAAAGGGFRAPVQTMHDFLTGTSGNSPSVVQPTFRGGAVSPCDLHGVLPPFVCSMMEKGFSQFEKRIRGFSAPYALLTGAETRTSSPVRMPREDNGAVKGHGNLYPAGEGAGYAGGITSASVDGLRAAYAVIRRFSPPD